MSGIMHMQHALARAKAEGVTAFKVGRDKSDNPYTEANAHTAWNTGFVEAEDAAAKAAEPQG